MRRRGSYKRLGKKQEKAIADQLAKNTDAGRKEAIKLYRDYMDAKAPLRQFPAERITDPRMACEDDGQWFGLMKRDDNHDSQFKWRWLARHGARVLRRTRRVVQGTVPGNASIRVSFAGHEFSALDVVRDSVIALDHKTISPILCGCLHPLTKKRQDAIKIGLINTDDTDQDPMVVVEVHDNATGVNGVALLPLLDMGVPPIPPTMSRADAEVEIVFNTASFVRKIDCLRTMHKEHKEARFFMVIIGEQDGQVRLATDADQIKVVMDLNSTKRFKITKGEGLEQRAFFKRDVVRAVSILAQLGGEKGELVVRVAPNQTHAQSTIATGGGSTARLNSVCWNEDGDVVI